ncbi:Peroxisomal biogenesis factor 19 [Pleurostoma richardsiae]|uniref:Peroxisomal biogenesis factor 19 n=1 Tax=Pleurostoma richardsiae TaxID=41990 RepID=A0AA38VWQ3_9PEZI|nr:Peroxisomal biogenesis factor 19 [Pleurostoma richardsiae]
MTDTKEVKEDAEVAKTEVKEVSEDDVDDVPDPDEDDLDDLDDMLDDFSSLKTNSKKPEAPDAAPIQSQPAFTAAAPAAPAAPAAATTQPSAEDVLSDDDFAKQLQAGMAELMGEMESSPELQAQFESIFTEIGAAAGDSEAKPGPGSASGSASGSSAKPSGAAASEASFQETIRRTMERMQTSGDQATAAAAAEGSDDFLAELMKQMQAGGLDGEGSEEDFSKMLLGMMEQLTNKEILYEPMKELDDKFPDWLEKNKDKVSKEDLKRYEEQQRYAKEIVAKFEEATYADSNPADREYIVDRMQKMQAAGSPPADLVGDMPSAQEALNAPDAESCAPQ